MEVLGRRKVSTTEAAIKLEDDLISRLTKFAEKDKKVIVTDFDLSQNHCPPDNFAALFSALSTASAHVQRLRLFGCPTLNDEVVLHLVEYLRTVTVEKAPTEMHLSDCAITTDGFESLMSVIEESDAFPCVNPVTKKKTPLYLRLENNYIDPSAIQAKIDSKVIKTFAKSWKTSITTLSGDAKVYLLKQPNDDKFGQKEGSPPAPEDVGPVTKPVNDAGRNKGNGKGDFQVSPWEMQQIGQLIEWIPQWQQDALANGLMELVGAGGSSWQHGSSGANQESKIHRHLTYMNGKGGFGNKIDIDKVKEAAQGVDLQAAMKVFTEVENKKDEIKDPTSYITTSLRKLGGRGGAVTAPEQAKWSAGSSAKGSWNAQPQWGKADHGKGQWNAQSAWGKAEQPKGNWNAQMPWGGVGKGKWNSQTVWGSAEQSKGKWNSQSSWGSAEQGKGKWNSQTQGATTQNKPQQSMPKVGTPAWAAASAVKKEVPLVAALKTASKVPIKPGVVAGTGPGAQGSAADRSRTPAGREAKKPIQGIQQPKAAPAGNKPKPPHPWVEQFSDEYKIPYYWNPETCESCWEMPKG